MLTNIITKIIGSRNDRILKKMQKVVTQVNQLETDFEALSDAELKAKTAEFQQRLAAGDSLDRDRKSVV